MAMAEAGVTKMEAGLDSVKGGGEGAATEMREAHLATMEMLRGGYKGGNNESWYAWWQRLVAVAKALATAKAMVVAAAVEGDDRDGGNGKW